MGRSVTVVLVAVVLAVGLALVAGHVFGAPDQPGPETPPAVAAPSGGSPVVAALPSTQRTEYEPDPFDSTRIRATETTTSAVVVVRADGTVEVRKIAK